MGTSCRKGEEKESCALGPYSGKFPTEVLYTGCFLERQTLSSPCHKRGNQGCQQGSDSAKVTEPERHNQGPRAGDGSQCTFATTILGLHEPCGIWAAALQDIHAFIQQTFLECCRVLGMRIIAGNKTDSHLYLPGTYILVGETENKYICIHIPGFFRWLQVLWKKV